MIKKVKGGWQAQSESGKSFGTYKSKKAALRRIAQMEYFKHKKGK